LFDKGFKGVDDHLLFVGKAKIHDLGFSSKGGV
jgi:hypothetical protein